MMKTHAENTPPDGLTAWRKAFFTKAKRANSMALFTSSRGDKTRNE
jgi:hypothetical protein